MMTVRDLIKELLEFNLDATVNIQTLYEESDIHMSWTCEDECSICESKKNCTHLFLETSSRNEDTDEMERDDGE